MSRDPFTMPGGYDAWKTRSPYDEMSPLDEAVAEIEAQHKTISTLVNLLDECADVIDDLLASGDFPPVRKEALGVIAVNLLGGIREALDRP